MEAMSAQGRRDGQSRGSSALGVDDRLSVADTPAHRACPQHLTDSEHFTIPLSILPLGHSLNWLRTRSRCITVYRGLTAKTLSRLHLAVLWTFSAPFRFYASPSIGGYGASRPPIAEQKPRRPFILFLSTPGWPPPSTTFGSRRRHWLSASTRLSVALAS